MVGRDGRREDVIEDEGVCVARRGRGLRDCSRGGRDTLVLAEWALEKECRT